MINTVDFKTKTEFINRKNVSYGDAWGIALDIGYSGVKGFSPNRVYRFPCYARKIDGQLLGMGSSLDTDIYYRDSADGSIWAVGECAQSMITSADAQDSNAALYGRNRYFGPMYKVVARTGLALGMVANSFGNPEGKKLVVQTGLPPAYIKSDAGLLREVLADTHKFELKVGSGEWQQFCFALAPSDIYLMEQPLGTLISIATAQDGTKSPDADKYFGSRILIADPGFGTFDIFNLSNKIVLDTQTSDKYGMKAVLQRTADEIFRLYGTELRVPAMQTNLAKGTFTKFDRKTMKTEQIEFASILEEQSKAVCIEAIEYIKNIYNSLLDHDYLVITGGTGEAWDQYIREHFQFMDNLTVLPGNLNDTLSYAYSNVRGYYMFLQSRQRKAAMNAK